MKYRRLKLKLESAIEAFQARHWKHFQEDNERNIIKIEVPIADGESYIVDLTYKDTEERDNIVNKLLNAGFFQQEIIITSDW